MSLKKTLLNLQLTQEIIECREIITNGISYRTGDGLFVSREGYQYMIVIGKICKILYEETEIYFILEVMETEFIQHLRAYKLGRLLEYRCLSFTELISFQKLHMYQINSFLYAKPKYGLVEYFL